jgi:hypothetical protein
MVVAVVSWRILWNALPAKLAHNDKGLHANQPTTTTTKQGSITGAFLPHGRPDQTIIPSFILLAVQDTKMVCYVYELVNNNETVEVSKTELVKKTPQHIPSSSGSVATPALLDNLLK